MKTLAWLLVLTGVLVVAVYAVAERSSSVRYDTAPAVRGSISTVVSATGTLDAFVTVEVGSQLSGQISQLHADFNDKVQKGSPLATLDQIGFRARVKRAEAELEIAKAGLESSIVSVQKAKADYSNTTSERRVLEAGVVSARADHEKAVLQHQRIAELVKRKAISASEVEDASADQRSLKGKLEAAEARLAVQDAKIEAARAAVRIASAAIDDARAKIAERQAALEEYEYDLNRAVITSPIDGIVIGREIDVGQTVAASLEAPRLFTIANDLTDMKVYAHIDEADVGRIAVGQLATFTVDAFPGRNFTGEVMQIRKAPVVEHNVVTYTVVIAAKNSENLLLPGMTALVRLTTERQDDLLKIPSAALHFHPSSVKPSGDGGPPMVWVVAEDGYPKSMPVTVGLSDGVYTAVVASDLTEATQVIVREAREADSWRVLGFRLGF